MERPTLESRVQASSPALVQKLERRVARGVDWLMAHWVAALNILFLLYVGLPLLAPALMELGAETPAQVIYTIYRPACHQLPERSFFLFGEQPIYTRAELPANGVADSDNIFVRRNYIGDPEHGYKVAICERDVAIYGSMFLMGLIFALMRGHLPKLKARDLLLFALPMAVDGLTQLVGLRESSWLLRVITGGLFGVGLVWFAYPHVEEAMKQAMKQSSERPHADGG